jgi:hypothetical protein
MSVTTNNNLRLMSLSIRYFLRIEAEDITPLGNHLIIRGENGVGKSAVLNAIWAILSGRSGPDIEEPINEDGDEAYISADLGEFLIEKRWKRNATGDPRLVVKDRSGQRLAKPQDVLNNLISRYCLDPIAFLRRKPADQIGDVLRIAGIEPPANRVKTITGKTYEPYGDETADQYLLRLCGDKGEIYVERTAATRTLEQKQAALRDHIGTLDSLGGIVKPGEEPATATDILNTIALLMHAADKRRAALADAAAIDEKRSSRLHELDKKRTSLHESIERAESIELQIAELQRKLEAERSRSDALSNEISQDEAWCSGLETAYAVAQAAAEQLPDHAAAIAAKRD